MVRYNSRIAQFGAGFGDLIAPFIGIKLIDLAVTGLYLA